MVKIVMVHSNNIKKVKSSSTSLIECKKENQFLWHYFAWKANNLYVQAYYYVMVSSATQMEASKKSSSFPFVFVLVVFESHMCQFVMRCVTEDVRMGPNDKVLK